MIKDGRLWILYFWGSCASRATAIKMNENAKGIAETYLHNTSANIMDRFAVVVSNEVQLLRYCT